MKNLSSAQREAKLLMPYFALGVGILALSLSALYVRWAQAPGTVTGFYRLLLSTVIIFPFFAKRNAAVRRLTWRAILPPILGGICMAGTFSLWNTSLFYTNVASASMIGNISPVWVALAAWGLLHERLPARFWLGLAGILLGTGLIMGGNFFVQPRLGLGDMLAAASSVFYAGYILITQWGRKGLDSLSLVWINGASACLGMLLVILVLGQPLSGFPLQTWIIFLAAAVITQNTGYLAISYALGHLPASVVSPSMNLQPVVTILLAIAFLHEVPSGWQMAGSALILGGVYLINYVHQQNKAINAVQ